MNRMVNPEYYGLAGLAGLAIGRREPELVGASGPPVPDHGAEWAGRGSHRGERLVPGQRAEHGLRPAQQRPPAEGSADGHPHAQPNQDNPAGDEAGEEPAPLGRRRGIGPDQGRRAAPAANSRAPRATERQVAESAAVSPVAPHRIQPQPPGTRLTSTYPSRAQNTAPSAAMLAPATAGYAPLQTSTPAAHSTPPAAQVRCLHRCRGIRSARLMAVPSSRPRAARYSLPAPATARVAPQLTAQPAMTDAVT